MPLSIEKLRGLPSNGHSQPTTSIWANVNSNFWDSVQDSSAGKARRFLGYQVLEEDTRPYFERLNNAGNGALKSHETENAIVNLSKDVAHLLGSKKVKSVHLLLALAMIKEPDDQSSKIIQNFIKRKYPFSNPMRKLVDNLPIPLDTGKTVEKTNIEISPAVKEVLKAANIIAKDSFLGHTGTVHILVALLYCASNDKYISDFIAEYKSGVTEFLKTFGLNLAKRDEDFIVCAVASSLFPGGGLFAGALSFMLDKTKLSWNELWRQHCIRLEDNDFVTYRYLTTDCRDIEEKMVKIAASGGYSNVYLEHFFLALIANDGNDLFARFVVEKLLGKRLYVRMPEEENQSGKRVDPLYNRLCEYLLDRNLDLVEMATWDRKSVEPGQDDEIINPPNHPMIIYPMPEVLEVFKKAESSANGKPVTTLDLLLEFYDVVYNPKRGNTLGYLQRKLEFAGLYQQDIESMIERMIEAAKNLR